MKSFMKKYFNNITNKRFLKSIFLFLGLQLITYMFVKLFQTGYHTFDFDIDKKIPFIPQVIIIYNLFYPMMFIAFYNIFNKDEKTYFKGIMAGIIGYIICDIIFLVYPVEMIRPDISTISIDPINKLVLYLTYLLDTPAINCFPSIHCLFCFQAIYSTIICKDFKKLNKTISIIILSLIIISTLLVKQHYLYDVLAGLVLVIISNIITYIIFQKKGL